MVTKLKKNFFIAACLGQDVQQIIAFIYSQTIQTNHHMIRINLIYIRQDLFLFSAVSAVKYGKPKWLKFTLGKMQGVKI